MSSQIEKNPFAFDELSALLNANKVQPKQQKSPFAFDELAALLNANSIQPQSEDQDKDYEAWNQENKGKKLVASVASAIQRTGEAFIGATIGMFLGPITGIFGIISGGIIGSVSTIIAADKITDTFSKNKKKYIPEQLLSEAVDFLDLPTIFSPLQLQKAKLDKVSHYHPDKWMKESKERRKAIAQKFTKTLTYYEILKSVLEMGIEKQVRQTQPL